MSEESEECSPIAKVGSLFDKAKKIIGLKSEHKRIAFKTRSMSSFTSQGSG